MPSYYLTPFDYSGSINRVFRYETNAQERQELELFRQQLARMLTQRTETKEQRQRREQREALQATIDNLRTPD